MMIALLGKLPQMPSCSANNANLDKNNLEMFYKIYCCVAIHGRIWMNNAPNESRIIMLSCTEISFVINFFKFEKFGVKPGFPFFSTHTVYENIFLAVYYNTSDIFLSFQNCVIRDGSQAHLRSVDVNGFPRFHIWWVLYDFESENVEIK